MYSLQMITLKKEHLDRIPDAERFFYIMSGHFANDVHILSLLLMAAFNNAFDARDGKIKEGPNGHAAVAQTFLILKLLIGRLHEANRFITKNYLKKNLHRYEADMDAREAAARQKFTMYFDQKQNILKEIRDKFSAHYDTKAIVDVLKQLPNSFKFIQYFGGCAGHSLFYGSEMLILNAMASKVQGAHNVHDGINAIYRDAVEMSECLAAFVIGFIRVIIKKYLNPFSTTQIRDIELGDLTSVSDYSLPFFAGPPYS